MVPVALTLAGAHGDALFTPVLMPVRAEGLAALLALSTLSGFLMLRCATPNPFMLGPLFFSIAVTVAGWEFSAMPSVFSNAGQICIAVNRIVVMKSVADEFVGELAAIVDALHVGDPIEPDVVMGPTTTAAVLEKTQQHVDILERFVNL